MRVGGTLAGGPVELEVSSCPSTQDELRMLAEQGAPAFSWVRTEEQTAGRGRRGRAWVAPPASSLLASVLLRPARPVAELGAVSLVGGLAACELARELGVDARLRWPNDVVTRRGKLAGVLPELIPGPAVVLGVGMNVSQDEPALPQAGRLPATSLRLEGVTPPPVRALLLRLVELLRHAVAAFDGSGFPALAPRARELDDLLGRELRLELARGVRTGEGAGIADDGALLVRTQHGVEAHHAGEVAGVSG